MRIIKGAARKLKHNTVRDKLNVSDDDCVSETTMAQNMLPSYSGVSPAQALLGVPPRDLYEGNSEALDSYIGSVESEPDAMERVLRLRLLAKDAIIQTIIEDRIARANNTRTQTQHVAELVVGPKTRDIYRSPDRRVLGQGGSGWHGPADLLEVSPDNSKAIVKWQGMPLLLPIRHIRKHIGCIQTLLTHYQQPSHFIYNNNSHSKAASLLKLMDSQ